MEGGRGGGGEKTRSDAKTQVLITRGDVTIIRFHTQLCTGREHPSLTEVVDR